MTEQARAVVYCRVSTEAQGESGLSLESQAQRGIAHTEAQGWEIAEVISEVVSGTVPPHEREGMSKALRLLRSGQADVLIVASISRLGRHTSSVLALCEEAHTQGWGVSFLDLQISTSSAVGRCCLAVLASVSQLERDLTSERTVHALGVLKDRGVRLGRPASEQTRNAGRRATELRTEGLSWAQVCTVLEAEQLRTAQGLGRWSVTQVRRAVRTVVLDGEAKAAYNAHIQYLREPSHGCELNSSCTATDQLASVVR